MSKVDMLFLERHCVKCGSIKAVLDIEAVEEEEFRGRDGQELYVFSSQSPSASAVLLKSFGIKANMPVLITYEGKTMNSPKRIVEYLSKQKMVI